jgi:hypothetical protein
MLADGAKKVIPSFSKFCRDNFTSLALIHKAYEAAAAAAAASNPPFLVSAAASPTDASNCFEVSTRPGGYAAVCTSEKVVVHMMMNSTYLKPKTQNVLWECICEAKQLLLMSLLQPILYQHRNVT